MTITDPLPANIAKVIEDILEGHNSKVTNDALLRRFAVRAQRTFILNDGSIQVPVHCECGLVDYFNNPTLVSYEMSPVNILGVSNVGI